MLFWTAVIAYLVVEAVLWTCITDDASDSSFSRWLEAPIVLRWRRQHRWIMAIVSLLAVAWLGFLMIAGY